MDYKAPDNIYWLFSSSAQAIAAFIGFLAAGFFFVYDRIDKQVDKDETLEEIYADIKIQYYIRLRALFVLTGLSIILSLVIVFINGYNLGWFGILLKWLVALLNVGTIVWAILFVIFIIEPDKVTRTAKKLIEENKDVFESHGEGTISTQFYLDKFDELEKLLRNIAAKYGLENYRRNRYGSLMSVNEIMRALYYRRQIDPQQLRDLSEATKIRNLIAHGEIKSIEVKQGKIVDNLINELRKYNQ